MRFLVGLANVVFAWPVYATWHAVALAKTYDGFRAQVVTFTAFLPIIIVTTAIWALVWALTLWLLMHNA